MAISVKKPEVDELVREVCELTGESLTSAIEVSLRERLDRLRAEEDERISRRKADFAVKVRRLQERARAASILPPDPEGAMAAMDKILWDEDGFPA